MYDPKDFLAQKLSQKPTDTKKFIYTIVLLANVLLVWAGSLICIFIKPDLAGNLTSLAQIAIAAVLALGTALLTGQAVFDYKLTSAIQTVDTNDKEEKINTENQNTNTNTTTTEHIIHEGDENAPKVKPFAQAAT